jgi:hypothetical protein
MRPERRTKGKPQPGAGQPAPAVFLLDTPRPSRPAIAPLTIFKERADSAIE